MHEEFNMREIVQAYHEVFGSRAGQIVLEDLTRRFGFVERSTMGEDYNTNRMIHNEGQRFVLVGIGTMLNLNPNEIPEKEGTETDV